MEMMGLKVYLMGLKVMNVMNGMNIWRSHRISWYIMGFCGDLFCGIQSGFDRIDLLGYQGKNNGINGRYWMGFTVMWWDSWDMMGSHHDQLASTKFVQKRRTLPKMVFFGGSCALHANPGLVLFLFIKGSLWKIMRKENLCVLGSKHVIPGWWYTYPLKNMSESVGLIIPNI